MNNSELLLLSLINQQPRYGYQIAQFLAETNAHLWVNVSMPYVYRLLKNFAARGWVTARTVESTNNRPNKTIYEITKKGQAALSEKLAELKFSSDKIYFGMDVAMAVYTITGGIFNLPALIQTQINHIETELAQYEHIQFEPIELTAEAAMARLIIEHRIFFLQSELEWLKKAFTKLSEMENGKDIIRQG
ncbi:MAG: PadR family transcriptional regulator [Firmicutes bacterium]|nr:PadR family transcriptional regulator [Bacillota bacterium]